MQLNYSRRGLLKMLWFIALLILIFAGAIGVAIWIDDPRRIGLFGAALLGLPAALWCFVKGIWLLRSKAPAAVATESGIEFQKFDRRRSVPWNQIAAIGEAELDSGRAKLKVIEIRLRGRRPIRLPIRLLADTQTEIDRWITAARLRLA